MYPRNKAPVHKAPRRRRWSPEPKEFITLFWTGVNGVTVSNLHSLHTSDESWVDSIEKRTSIECKDRVSHTRLMDYSCISHHLNTRPYITDKPANYPLTMASRSSPFLEVIVLRLYRSGGTPY